MLENTKDLQGDTPEDELTREQLLERLSGARLIVQSLQRNMELNALDFDRELALTQRLRRDLVGERAFMGRLALRLARAGSYDHKGKNEVLLDVIADLLAQSARVPETATDADHDDIPF